MSSLLTWLLVRRRAVLAVIGLVALAMVPGALRIETDNSPEVFYLEGSEEVARYHRLREDFGTDEAVRLVISGPKLWSR